MPGNMVAYLSSQETIEKIENVLLGMIVFALAREVFKIGFS